MPSSLSSSDNPCQDSARIPGISGGRAPARGEGKAGQNGVGEKKPSARGFGLPQRGSNWLKPNRKRSLGAAWPPTQNYYLCYLDANISTCGACFGFGGCPALTSTQILRGGYLWWGNWRKDVKRKKRIKKKCKKVTFFAFFACLPFRFFEVFGGFAHDNRSWVEKVQTMFNCTML